MEQATLVRAQVSQIEERLKYTFKNKNLLCLAFVHRSYFNEHRDQVDNHNERLEFLGDAVLGLLISEFLYAKLPFSSEGELSHLKAHIVEAATCNEFLEKLDVERFLLLGRGEKRGSGRGRETILADLFEALIGAIFMDGGFESAKCFFFGHFQQDVELAMKEPMRNWKAELQDYSQKKYQKPPVYKVVKESGPDHSKIFHITAVIDDKEMGSGVGFSKKEAEQAAAEDALKRLQKRKEEV